MPDEYKKCRIYLKGEERTDDILSINLIGHRYDVKFKDGKEYKYNVSNVRIVKSALNEKKSYDCFEYLKSVAAAIGLIVKFEDNKIIILSTVDNEISEFADNANRLNVAISRAIDQLIVIVSDSDMRRDTNISDLIRYIQYNNFSVIESEVFSVFDYLYKSYADCRREFLKKQKRISEYDSENLMYSLIIDILKNERFRSFDAAVHVPLKMIIRDLNKLSVIEKEYAANILTHIDFLIFDKIGKAARLAIEVDGTSFHAEGSRQYERDTMKNNILMKYNLPLVRFRTNESSERKRLIAALDNISHNA